MGVGRRLSEKTSMRLGILNPFGCFDQTATTTSRDRSVAAAPAKFKSFDLRQEYASAFQTESYNDLLERVSDMPTFAKEDPSSASEPGEGSCDGFSSRHSFVHSFLEPDPATVATVLARARVEDHCTPDDGAVLGDFFAETGHASLLCGLLLEDVEHVRRLCRSMKAALDSDTAEEHLVDLSNSTNPFSSHAPSQREFRSMHGASSSLLRRLHSQRNKARARLRLTRNLRRCVAIVLVTVTASACLSGIFIAFHAVLVVAVLPPIMTTPRLFRALSSRWTRRSLARLDAAAKGVYILNRDLETMSRLVARLRDEVEHMLAMVRFWSKRGWPVEEVVRRLREKEACFDEQLEELEEHLLLCFVTINKARSLVVKEILNI